MISDTWHRKEVLTYKKAKAIYEAGKAKARSFNPDRGVSLVGDSRLVRNNNGSYTLWHFSRRRRYGDKAFKVFTIQPNDKFTIHGNHDLYWHRSHFDAVALKRILEYAPVKGRIWRGGHGEVWATAPKAKNEPKPVDESKRVPSVYYTSKDGTSTSNRTRAEYEADLATYGNGSMEAWHEAYFAWDKKRVEAEERYHDWKREANVRIFDGMVIDAKGVVSQRSIDQIGARERAGKRERIAERKRQEEAERKERERRNRAHKSLQKKIKVKLTDAKVVEWLANNNLTPNPDGKTVNLLKNVNENFVSRHRTEYKIGKKVTAPDYTTTPDCVGGLFFSPSKGHLPASSGFGPKTIECQCDLATMVVVQFGWHGVGKVKTKTCEVLREV